MTFFIALFVLLMQFLWKYIDDLVGKGLDAMVVVELLFYTSANLVPLALPLAILVSSIMTFGNLAEHFEITAAKAAGISLQKLMRPLFLLAGIISVLAFFFSNHVLPYTNLKAGSLLYDVREQKPALSIREGVFYNGIEGYSMKVGKKDSDGQTIHQVMIYDHTTGTGNRKVILAETGTMRMTTDKRFLEVTLYKGNSYEEQNKVRNGTDSHPLMRNSFAEYRILFDMSQFNLNRSNEEIFKGSHQMLNMSQLQVSVDSFETQYKKRQQDASENLFSYYLFRREADSFLTKLNAVPAINPFPALQSSDAVVIEAAQNQARSLSAFFGSYADDLETRRNQIARYEVEWHRKLTLSAACFLLFLIGAPLGAIIRKGGMGMPLVVSIAFFLLYHVTSITGEKFAKEGIIPAARGMWMSSLFLFPVGIFLIYKATHDSALFDWESYRRLFSRFKRKKGK